MDLLLKSAICEITKVFESSINDHQVELSQKGEEISMLRLELEQAQIKLREQWSGATADNTVSRSEEVTIDSGKTPLSVSEVTDYGTLFRIFRRAILNNLNLHHHIPNS